MALPPRLFCDTSFFYACFDPRDVNHPQAEDLSAEAVEAGSTLYVTWDIISETLTLLRYRRSYREALAFLSEIKPDIHLVNYGDSVPPLRARPQTFFLRRGLIRSCNYAPQ